MIKKKIGIATLYNNSTNYGGCLQAYALCKVLQNMGYDAKQISYKRKNDSLSFRIKSSIKKKRIINVLFMIIKTYFNRKMGRIFKVDNKIEQFKKSFYIFRDNIPHTNIIYSDDSLNSCEEFDVYITGSDQVWNVGIADELSRFYFLKFVRDDKIKISYAASISMKNFPVKFHNEIEKILSSYKAVSVREQQDQKLINGILKKDVAQWVLDPTLLLSCKDYLEISKPNPYSNEKYIFAYLLGDRKSDRAFITNFARQKNLKIITIPYLLGYYRKHDRNFGDIQIHDVSPEMWISLIKDSQYVFTDSFHGSVFSIIFHKPFFAFKRNDDNMDLSMNSRLYSLFNLLGLEKRMISSTSLINDVISEKPIDFDSVDQILNKQKGHSIDFLVNAIEG